MIYNPYVQYDRLRFAVIQVEKCFLYIMDYTEG